MIFALIIASVLENFAAPSYEYRPETWFQVSGGNFSKQGTTLDLEAIARAGFNGIHFFHEQVGASVAWPGVTEQVPCMSEKWEEHVRHLGDECKRLNLRLLMHTCPGWSMAGGPWIPADKTMRELVFSKAEQKGGKVKEVALPSKATDAKWRDYKDITMIAFPSPKGDIFTPLTPKKVKGSRTTDQITVREYYCQPIVTRDLDDEKKSAANWEAATIGNGNVRFAFPKENDEAFVELDYGEVVTVRTLEISPVQRMNHFWSFQPDVEVVAEAKMGGAWKEISRRKMPQSTWQDDKPISLALPETTAQEYRVRFLHTHPLILSFVRFYSGARPDNFEAESAKTLRSLMRDKKNVVAQSEIIDQNKILKVKVGDELPQGDWTILRIGNVNSGIRNHPAPPEATGWECDKLSSKGADVHYAGYIGKLIDKGGALAEGRLAGLLMDSWECEAQNWTEGLDKVFAKRWGYELEKWWPALCGYVVDGEEKTSLFYRDWRELLGDLVYEEFYGRMAKLAHEHNQVITYETCGGDVFPSDAMKHWKFADVPMCEFWRPRTKVGGVGSPDYKAIRPCVSAARIYGKKRIAAEALTKAGPDWSVEHPRFFKRDLDHYFALGVTHMVFGNFTHNPQDDAFAPPGPTYAPAIAIPMMRKHTWWKSAREFTDYLTRTQFLLEQGRNVSDILMYLGDAVDHKPPHHLPFPDGFKYDYLNRDALMERLFIKDGMWTTPEGLQWKALWIYDSQWLRKETKQKLVAAEKAGAKVIRGDIFTLIDKMGLKPQVKMPRNLMWQHRTTGEEEIYFIAEEDGKPFKGEIVLRGKGKVVIADPVSGKTIGVDAKKVGEYVKFNLELPEAGARFVVINQQGAEKEIALGEAKELKGNWKLTFEPGWGIDKSIEIAELKSWTELPLTEEGKAYSGTVTYETEFECEAATNWAKLDLGRVELSAEVWLNNEKVGSVWTWPYNVDISGKVRKGKNKLKIAVTGTWINRLRYDAALKTQARKTWTNVFPDPKVPAQTSGLLGPVRIIKSSIEEIKVEGAPFELTVKQWTPPKKRWLITDYGAKQNGKPVTEAIERAIKAASSSQGGGRVVVPKGEWISGAFRLASNVALELEKDAVLHFPDDPVIIYRAPMKADGKPTKTCSALISASGCTNVAVMGEGTIKCDVDYWHNEHRKNEKAGFPRPQVMLFGRCGNVRLEGFKIRGAPAWTMHTLMCEDIVIRGVDSSSKGPNTDGIDLESCNRALIENCCLDQGDDLYTIKSGMNEVGRKRNIPTQNVVVRNCRVKSGGSLLGIGSEVSGGIRNIYMTNCVVEQESKFYLRVKTNSKRGAFIENVTIENIRGHSAKHSVVNVEMYYDGNPNKELTGKDENAFLTRISNITARNIVCDEADYGVYVNGDERLPPKGVVIEDVHVGKLRKGKEVLTIKNLDNAKISRVTKGDEK